MASQSPEPALQDHKSLKPVSSDEKDERNGSVEMNGHDSNADVTSEPKPQETLAPSSKTKGETIGDLPEETQEASPPNDIFSSEPQAQNSEITEPEPGSLADADAQPNTEMTKGQPDDTEMADAQDDAPVGDAPVDEALQTTTAAATDPKAPSPLPEVANEETNQDTSTTPQPDIEMGDVSPTAAVSSSVEPAASTQDTAISERPVTTLADDLSLHPASMSSLAIDANLASPANVTTADTSMSDVAQSPVKVARGRDEDEEDGPAAKRVKTDPPSDVVEVRTSPQDAMAVDQKGADETALYKEDGRPKTLADPSLDGNPITRYQANRLRVILAGIKKTKAGVNFKAPVRSMWPQLWDEYRLKVTEPTDISTMERRLKSAGDPEYPPYENMGAFKRDLELIYTNSVRFNGELHTVTQQAKTMHDQVLERMASYPAVESSVDEKKAPKQHPTRHTEPRTAVQSSPAQPPRHPSKPAIPSPVDKTAQSPAFAIPPNNHGVPLIRRDSTKNVDDRPKRPVHPPKSKDFGYDVKKKKKLSPELRFCSEVLDELSKVKHHQYNVYFLRPVDPIAEHIPNYFKMIRRPMDLETMGEKLSTGQYTSAREFEKDFFQIVKNANIFNGPDHHVTASAHQLADVFREEWAKKDAWMAKRAPQAVSQAQVSVSASRAIKDEEDEEDEADSEDDAEEKQAETSSRHLEVLQQRLKEENDKLNEQMNAKVPDINMVDVQQSMIALLQKQIIQERQRLAADAPPAKKGGGANSKPAAKAKKSGGGSKKRLPTAQGTAGASGGGAGGRKSGGAGGGTKKAAKRHMGALEKEVIGEAIPRLEGVTLERAIDIIKKDTNQNENDSGELELDIEALSQEALTKLYDMSIKQFPNMREEKERAMMALAPPPPEPVAKPKPKPKKNKPMGKAEQEARLRQLSDLKAALKGRGSNSQEPIESVEGNGGATPVGGQTAGGQTAGGQTASAAFDSDEEESSEEE